MPTPLPRKIGDTRSPRAAVARAARTVDRAAASHCHNNTTPSGPSSHATTTRHPSTMSKVAPEGDILDEAERLTAAPATLVHYDYAIVVPKVSPAYLKELKERVENAGFVTEEFDALSGQYEVSVLKLGAPQQRSWSSRSPRACPGASTRPSSRRPRRH